MRPANLTNVVLDFLWLPGAFAMLKTMTLHALGILTKEARDFVSESEQRQSGILEPSHRGEASFPGQSTRPELGRSASQC
jgi:hypothetical protein